MLVAIVGNPNTGKTTLFNALTGYRQRVGNYPGVTVEKKTGFLRGEKDGSKIEVIDLPGAYSLAARSADEAVVLDVLLGQQRGAELPDLVVAVADATDLPRSLFLISQMVELGRPVVVALNMTDLAEDAGLRIEADALARELGIAVVPVVATKQIGVEPLIHAIEDSFNAPASTRCPAFPASVRAELDGLTHSVSHRFGKCRGGACRAELLQTLLEPGGYHETRLVGRCGRGLAEELAQRRCRIEAAGESITEVEARIRYAWIDRVVERVVTRGAPPRRSRSEVIDRVLTHRIFGLAILLLMMGMCFQCVYAWATPVMDAIEVGFGWVGGLLSEGLPAGAVRSLLTNGVVAGVGAVLIFLPQILILFLFLAILEDCGYMSRAAFLLDRWMNLLGLSGKSFIPLLSSFACAVPGIMATRTIEDRRDRFITMLIAPLMSCSARLPIYALLIGAFIPAKRLLGGVADLRAVTLLLMYLVGVIAAIGVALVLRRTTLKGTAQPFLLVLPKYGWPSPKTVLYRMYEQGKVFCVTAGTLIFAVTIVVWALGYYPRSASIAADHDAQRAAAREVHAAEVARITSPVVGEDRAAALSAADRALEDRLSRTDRSESGEHLRNSVLGRMGSWVEPVVKPLGWDWRIGTAVIASFPAREVVIATMGTIYNLGDDQNETSASLRDRLHSATWPDGRPVYNLAVALSIMVFFALCCQCGATLATIKRETNSWRWPMFMFAYMTTLAYLGALVTYRIAIRFV